MVTSASPRRSAADMITQAIIERLEQGTRPWVRPWTGAAVSRPLRVCGTPYRGINTLWLWMMADAAGHSSPFWLTYRQAQLQGGQVRKGERGTVAIFYTQYRRQPEQQDDSEPDGGVRRVLKSFTVFNACQIEGLSTHFFPASRPAWGATARDRELERFFAAVPATIRHGGDEAYYRPIPDDIVMPEPGAFTDPDHYRATLAHELAHWTGHGSRLARDLSGRFGSDSYAMEELVAEMTAAMVGAELGLPVAHLDHHASYVASWLKVLKADSRAVLTAAAKAEEASALLCGFMQAAAAGKHSGPPNPQLLVA